MASTGSKRHPHKYMKIRGIWYCALPDCTHFMPRNMELGVMGKKSVCWNCGEEFIMDERSIKMEQPICYDCTPEGEAVKNFDIDEFQRLQQEKSRILKLEDEKKSLFGD